MTDDEYGAVSFLMENAWKGDLDEDRRSAYRVFLDRFDAAEVLAALHSLAEDSGPFLPSASEIVQRVRALTDPPPPSWPEVWGALMGAARRGLAKDQAIARLEAAHPLIARFAEAVGWDRLRLTGFDDPQYGELRQRELEARWAEFVDVARARLTQGRALAATSERRGLGPRRLDQVALLSAVPAPSPELPEGPAGGAA